jgi:hypothetical protein
VDDDRHAFVRRFRLRVETGPDVEREALSSGTSLVIGAEAGVGLELADRAVSRFHCEIVIHGEHVHVRDLGSRNGTSVDGVAIIDALLHSAAILGIGRNRVRFDVVPDHVRITLSVRTRCGKLVGTSVAMRAAFARLERAAASDVAVLLTGERGTGKTTAAAVLHTASTRRNHPFIPVDCGALASPAELDVTACAAAGGTIFLDDIGALAVELQPALLRVLDRRELRVVAATHRDLRGAINARMFRADLYRRLATVEIRMPALSERLDDIPLLVEDLLDGDGGSELDRSRLQSAGFLAHLTALRWPGNVGELRDYLRRWIHRRNDVHGRCRAWINRS